MSGEKEFMSQRDTDLSDIYVLKIEPFHDNHAQYWSFLAFFHSLLT